MDKLYNNFIKYLESEEKEKAVQYVLSILENREIDIVSLYEGILAPSLNNMACKIEDKGMCIWKEHVRSSIVRTIIECCYPYIIDERNKKCIEKQEERVIVVCPSEEYHEIGARMAADFFTLCGYDCVFVGSNTPKEDFISAIDVIRPKYIAVCISNYYNLVAGKRLIDKIREKSSEVVILVGGHAFENNRGAVKDIGADILVNSYKDIEGLSKEGKI